MTHWLLHDRRRFSNDDIVDENLAVPTSRRNPCVSITGVESGQLHDILGVVLSFRDDPIEFDIVYEHAP
jgi:hypothetical protein